ncbi:MAG: glutaminyl-peptide cyclotransferase [Caldilineaceae bacterium]
MPTLLGALLLAAIVLAGCGGSDAQEQAPAPTAATQAATAAATAAVTEVTTESATAAAPTADLAAAQPASPLEPAMPADAHPTSMVAPKLYTYRIVNVYPHDQGAFTEGLTVRDGKFLEGTGHEGQSDLRRVEIETGKVLESRPLDKQYFGEGVTELNGKIYQLTWKNGTGFIYDAATLAPAGQFQYSTEGWGMTHDGQRLIVSDGTPTIQFWDPATLQQVGGIYVSMFGLPISQINELEYFDDAIWANVWQTNLVVRIDPKTGLVTGVVDFTGLLDYAPPAQKPTDVLNGIAYDEVTGRLFVTGKYWPAVFEIELLEVKQ